MATPAPGPPVVVVGAGLAGLVTARILSDRGRRVVVVDRGATPGGRAATATVDGAVADTGAQFFTVRSDAFAGLLADWRDAGCPVREWCRGFWQVDTVRDHPGTARLADDGHPRYVVDGGMASLAEHLAAGLDVDLGREADAVSASADGWSVTTGGGRVVDGGGLVCAVPAPDAAALLAAGHVDVPTAAVSALRVAFAPCLALVAALDRPPAIPPPGGVQCASGTVTWLADNVAKGLSAQPCVTVHAAGDWSDAHWTDTDDEIAGALLEAVHGWLDGAAAVGTAVHRWRRARPVEVTDERVVVIAADPPLLVAGDACGGPRVEGAVLSGLAAAQRLAGGAQRS